MLLVRNEKYGGTSFDQDNGEFYRFNGDVLEVLMKKVFSDNLDQVEVDLLKQKYPGVVENNKKLFLEIKKYISSPYNTPLVSESPEFVDLTLLNDCNLSCDFCYTSSIAHGQIMSMPDYYHVMDELAKNRVYQVAIGGGEPTLHPNFSEILASMREQYNIVPNYTTNATLLTPDLLKLTGEMCGAIAISYHKSREKLLLKKAKELHDYGINSTLHVIANKENLPHFVEITKKFAEAGINSLAFLLFKPVGRGTNLQHEILTVQDKKMLDQSFGEAFTIAKDYGTNIGFDSCFAPYLKDFPYVRKGTFDSCTGSRFSAYIDWDLNVRPCSFIQTEKGESLREKSLQEIWWGTYFDEFRKKLLQPRRNACNNCTNFIYCFGGCPIEEKIVLCETIQK